MMILKPLSIIVHASAVAGFLVECSAVAATVGPIDWASWRRMALGWRFWMGLGWSGMVLGFGSIIGCLVLLAARQSLAAGQPMGIKNDFWLNLGTIALAPFVPAMAAV